MSGRRLKGILIVATLAVSGLALIAWTQSWFALTLVQGTHAGTTVDVPGEAAGPAVAALGLAGLALGGALGIAGRSFRIIFGVLELLIGASLVVSSVVALSDPAAASSQKVTELTGVSGGQAIHELVASTVPTAWPYIALVAGVLLAVVGIAVAVTFRRWPGPSRKFETVSADHGSEAPDAVDSWDDLSRGEDPTR